MKSRTPTIYRKMEKDTYSCYSLTNAIFFKSMFLFHYIKNSLRIHFLFEEFLNFIVARKANAFPRCARKLSFKSYFRRYYFLAIYFKVKNFVFLYIKKFVARIPLEYSVNIRFKSV